MPQPFLTRPVAVAGMGKTPNGPWPAVARAHQAALGQGGPTARHGPGPLGTARGLWAQPREKSTQPSGRGSQPRGEAPRPVAMAEPHARPVGDPITSTPSSPPPPPPHRTLTHSPGREWRGWAGGRGIPGVERGGGVQKQNFTGVMTVTILSLSLLHSPYYICNGGPRVARAVQARIMLAIIPIIHTLSGSSPRWLKPLMRQAFGDGRLCKASSTCHRSAVRSLLAAGTRR